MRKGKDSEPDGSGFTPLTKKHAEQVPRSDPQHWFIFFTGPPERTAGEKEMHTWGLNILPGGLEAPSWGLEAPTAPPPKRLASPSSEFYRMDLLTRFCSWILEVFRFTSFLVGSRSHLGFVIGTVPSNTDRDPVRRWFKNALAMKCKPTEGVFLILIFVIFKSLCTGTRVTYVSYSGLKGLVR